eukprot:265737-Prorocentrum_minimum.AAC.2
MPPTAPLPCADVRPFMPPTAPLPCADVRPFMPRTAFRNGSVSSNSTRTSRMRGRGSNMGLVRRGWKVGLDGKLDTFVIKWNMCESR